MKSIISKWLHSFPESLVGQTLYEVHGEVQASGCSEENFAGEEVQIQWWTYSSVSYLFCLLQRFRNAPWTKHEPCVATHESEKEKVVWGVEAKHFEGAKCILNDMARKSASTTWNMQQPAWNFVRVIPALKSMNQDPRIRLDWGAFCPKAFQMNLVPQRYSPKKVPSSKWIWSIWRVPVRLVATPRRSHQPSHAPACMARTPNSQSWSSCLAKILGPSGSMDPWIHVVCLVCHMVGSFEISTKTPN